MSVLLWVVLAAWVVTLGRTILNLLLVPRLRPRRPARMPLVSIVVPARNEERSIERAIRAHLAQSWPRFEIVVVNDRSADATGEILARLQKEDARVVVVDGSEPPEGWLGKPWALQQGSEQARGELLLFVDADVLYAPGALTAAVAEIEESDVAMLSLFPRFEMRGFWENVAIPYMATIAFTILPLWLANRTRIPIFAAGGGPGNLVRRRDYDAAGGHAQLKDAVVDDVALARLLRRGGCRTRMVRADDLVSLRMYHGGREVLDGFTKNAFAALFRSYVAAILSALFLLFLHVLPYAAAIAGSRLALATLGLILLVRLILFASLGYSLLYAAIGHLPMTLTWLVIATRSMWVTGVRGRLQWRGREYDASRTRFGGEAPRKDARR